MIKYDYIVQTGAQSDTEMQKASMHCALLLYPHSPIRNQAVRLPHAPAHASLLNVKTIGAVMYPSKSHEIPGTDIAKCLSP